ncbi:GlxA family transcriptional regulator [Maricaulis sp.]|uniref:GlxA family transcriptional regulator n=1 Tax=Maricaulis sp. TaxID=1486257 RepID=UPI0026061CFD|nr:GlxA family transcriptional regulator [Maricaulis sp.]
MAEKRTIRIGFLVFEGIQALDLFGPQEVFAEANSCGSDTATSYETLLISETGENVTTESGVTIGAHASLDNCPPLHTLIVPGGAGSRPDRIPQRVVDWVSRRATETRRLGSVCTGLFILARTGILDGRPVTTHWHHVDEAAKAFPNLNIAADALFVRDDGIITAAGITAGIDMALSLVEEDMGAGVAAQVARELVVFLRRPGGQNQYSSLLQRQAAENDKFAGLLAWIADNLTEDLSVEALAARACLSERHFRRSFKDLHNETPARAIERIRIDVAKDWLSASRLSIAEIARSVGFQSADAFRRAFERQVGATPRDYRQRFGHQHNQSQSFKE